jgi:hypothetical protein
MVVTLKNVHRDGGVWEKWCGARGGVSEGSGRFGCSRRRVQARAGSPRRSLPKRTTGRADGRGSKWVHPCVFCTCVKRLEVGK